MRGAKQRFTEEIFGKSNIIALDKLAYAKKQQIELLSVLRA
jgi:hypothetical protein